MIVLGPPRYGRAKNDVDVSPTQSPYSSSGSQLEKVLADLVNPAPLEILSESFINRTNDIRTLPLNLFPGEALCLRELELHNCLVAHTNVI